MYFYRLCVIFTALVVLICCSQRNFIMVGTARDQIRPEQVVIYEQEPQEYEVIALLTVKGKNAPTNQKKMDYAMKKLKSQAASIGANGLLLERIDEVSAKSRYSSTVTKGAYTGSSGTQLNVKGKAIFVQNQ